MARVHHIPARSCSCFWNGLEKWCSGRKRLTVEVSKEQFSERFKHETRGRPSSLWEMDNDAGHPRKSSTASAAFERQTTVDASAIIDVALISLDVFLAVMSRRWSGKFGDGVTGVFTPVLAKLPDIEINLFSASIGCTQFVCAV